MSTSDSSNQVRDRALGAVLRNAIFRWESLVTIVLTAVLFMAVPQPFPWWQDWFWLVGGAIAEAALVVATLTDENAAQEAVAREFANLHRRPDARDGDAEQFGGFVVEQLAGPGTGPAGGSQGTPLDCRGAKQALGKTARRKDPQ